ncbi:hypothetical protein B1B05_11480 [Domibacillus enclensis]|uniref:Cupin type-2 domain-containing protein n=1 Tax=Domibacillus enclensis TaxID=1017273 RepID=A0ABX4E820_9BACI|nr:hypothetical protein B1B05_11480 [Domibacillus enclensis]
MYPRENVRSEYFVLHDRGALPVHEHYHSAAGSLFYRSDCERNEGPSVVLKRRRSRFFLEGPIHLTLLEDEYELETGDSVKIPAYAKHRWENRGAREASILFSVTPPSF